MKIKSFKKINIFLSVIFAILLVAVVYVLAFRGSIPSYTRDELGIYMPYFSADYSDVYNGFTDSHGFYIFDLNKSEIKKVKVDIENNSSWFKFTGNSEEISLLNSVFGTWIEDYSIDINDCYVAFYDFSDDCFVYDTDGLVNCGCAIYDEDSERFYYLEMIW